MNRRRSRGRKNPLEDLKVEHLSGIIVLVFVVAVILWGALSSFFTVEADEVAVVLRFGRDTGELAQPGLNWKIPFGIDKPLVVRVDRVHTLEFGFETVAIPKRGRTQYRSGGQNARMVLTGDQNVVAVEWIIQYKIKNPANYLFNLKDPVDTIRDVSESTMRLVVGDSSATEVLTERRAQIAQDAETKLQQVLDTYESGIEIVTVELQNVSPPTAAVEDSFNEVNTAQQEKARTENEARREYHQAIPKAEGEALKVVQEAEGFRLKRVNEAKGDVALFTKLLAEYQTSREVTRQRLYLETLEVVLPQLTQIYVIDDANTGPLQVLDLKALGGRAAPRPRGDKGGEQ